MESEEFMLLPVNQLVDIISSDELNVGTEEQVFNAVMSWVKYNIQERRSHLPNVCLNLYIRKTVIDMQSSNPCPISTSQTTLCPFFKLSNRHPILKSMVVSHFLKSNDITDVCPNPKPSQKIGHRSENLERALLLRIALNWTVI